MAENTVVYTLEARDLATATLNRVRGSYDQLTNGAQNYQQALNSSTPSATAWQRQLDRLTTSHGLAYEGLRRMNSLISGTIWGIAAGAVAVLTTKVIEQVKAWADAQTALDKYHASLKTSIELAKRQDAVKKLLEAQTEAQRQLKDAQSEANALYGIGTFAQIDQAQSRVRRLQSDLEQIRRDLDAIDKPEVSIDKVQEQRGADIAAAARRRWDEAQKLILARSTFEVQIAEVTAENNRRMGELDLADARVRANDKKLIADWEQDQMTGAFRRGQIERDTIRSLEIQAEMQKANALGAVSGAILAVAGQRNRAAIALSKVLALAQIAIQTRVAYMAALAPPPLGLGPVAGQALANWVLLQGIASGVAVAAASLGGVGGSGGGEGGRSAVPATAREIGPSASSQPLPQTVNIYINGNLVDLSQLSRELRPYNIQLTKDTI